MKWRKIVVLFLVASMFLSLISCIRQTALPQEEHTSEENSTVQEKYTTEDSTYPQKETMDDLNNPEDIQDSGPADIQKEGYVTSSFSWKNQYLLGISAALPRQIDLQKSPPCLFHS